MTALIVIAVILGVIGVLGSVLPGLAGPPISWVGLLLMYLAHTSDPVSLTALLVWLAVVVVITVVDYFIPAALTRTFGGHKAASVGATIGLFAGMFLTPVGMIGGSILGAFIAELLVADHDVWSSFKAALGTFIGFMLTTGLNLILSGVLLWCIIDAIK